jgi:hypothetical protein
MDAWDERRKYLENEYFHKIDAKLIDQMRDESREKLVRELCRNRCPKCGDRLEALEFRGVPLDKCPGCGGVWLGPRDLRILAEKDHRTWFERWFGGEE